MKISVIDYYSSDSSPNKDPVTIPHGLMVSGHEVQLVSLNVNTKKFLFGIELLNINDWLKNNLVHAPPDVVIFISRFNPELTPILLAIKERGVKLIIKGDTDGSLGHPIPPRYLRTVPVWSHPLNLLRQFKWRMPVSYFVKERIKHIQLADIVVCESPGAKANLYTILDFWNLSHEAEKIRFIPNSIGEPFINSPVSKKKRHSVISIGRWDDRLTKGTDLLVGTIRKLLSVVKDIEFTIVGNHEEHLKRNIPVSISDMVRITGPLDQQELHEKLSSSEILLVPSRLESFSFASGEALCTGTSLVVTPIESLLYLSGGGLFGTIAHSFSIDSLSAALLNELKSWEWGRRDPEKIAEFWRAELNEFRVLRSWEGILKTLS